MGKREETFAAKVVPDILPPRVRTRDEEYVMLIGCGLGVVVEVVDYNGVAVGWELDVEFEEEGVERCRRGGFR